MIWATTSRTRHFVQRVGPSHWSGVSPAKEVGEVGALVLGEAHRVSHGWAVSVATSPE